MTCMNNKVAGKPANPFRCLDWGRAEGKVGLIGFGSNLQSSDWEDIYNLKYM